MQRAAGGRRKDREVRRVDVQHHRARLTLVHEQRFSRAGPAPVRRRDLVRGMGGFPDDVGLPPDDRDQSHDHHEPQDDARYGEAAEAASLETAAAPVFLMGLLWFGL